MALVMHAKAPGSVQWEDDEVWRINRVQVALILGITPQQVDQMSVQDVSDVLAVKQANDQIEADRMAKMRRVGRGK